MSLELSGSWIPLLPPSSAPEVPDYASTKLIAYIGNKRALLPRLLQVFLELDREYPVRFFLDPFAGSGSVSRLARSLGWSVAANDAEEYSRIVNEAWLGVSADELPSLFAGSGGIGTAFGAYNAMHPQREDSRPDGCGEPYIALHYAPASTGGADWRRERLFYTRENAVFLDRVRSAIERDYPAAPPGSPGDRKGAAERALLLGALVYEAATHANTSGVFKAYHKGFGGHGHDALGRILSPMALEPPLLWGGPPSLVARMDAAAFCSGKSADLCYLDPPYNQHQYGSNYHLLNTIARWDRAPVDDSRLPDGSLVRAAGIPPAWTESRSAFCSRRTARRAFEELLSSIDARTVVLSYNTEGLVPPEDLVELLSDRADVSLRSLDYVKYRGGRQSASRLCRNREILFVARRRESWSAAASADPKAVSAALEALKVDVELSKVLAGAFDPAKLAPLCLPAGPGNTGAVLVFGSGEAACTLRSYRCLVFEEEARSAPSTLDLEGKRTLTRLLAPLALPDNEASCRAAAELLEEGVGDRRLQALALYWLRKLAHPRYEDEFLSLSARLRILAASDEARLSALAAGIGAIQTLFETRIANSKRSSAGGPRRSAREATPGRSADRRSKGS